MATPRLGLKNDFSDPDTITDEWLKAVADAVDAAAGLGAGEPALSATDEVGDAITVTVQLQDATGADLAARRLVRIWLADLEYDGLCATAPNGGVTIDAGVELQTVATGKDWWVVTNVLGQARITLTESGAKAFWVHAAAGDRVAALQVVFE